MSDPTFVDACLAGTARVDEVDDWIEVWHHADTPLSLDDFLGLTPEEGALFASDPSVLEEIVDSYRE